MRCEDVLHPVPDLGADQRFAEAVLAGASEDRVALVVRVGEHFLDRGQPWGFEGRFGVGTVVSLRSTNSLCSIDVE